MFNYYGSKSKIAKLYPQPLYDTIIEPFAGSAQYSVLYHRREVILNDKYELVYNIWKWLIEEAESKDILQKTKFKLGEDIRKIKFKNINLKNMIGLCINAGVAKPAATVQRFVFGSGADYAVPLHNKLKYIARMVPKIKHWKITYGDYKEVKNRKATWFIDPPYQNIRGEGYIVDDINYKELAEWCTTRKGQVIVCENQNADWLDFRPLVKVGGLSKDNIECIWTNTKKKSIYSFM